MRTCSTKFYKALPPPMKVDKSALNVVRNHIEVSQEYRVFVLICFNLPISIPLPAGGPRGPATRRGPRWPRGARRPPWAARLTVYSHLGTRMNNNK